MKIRLFGLGESDLSLGSLWGLKISNLEGDYQDIQSEFEGSEEDLSGFLRDIGRDDDLSLYIPEEEDEYYLG